MRLRPWTKAHSLTRKIPLHFPPPSVVIHTDASRSGWDGQAPSQTYQGTWSQTFQRFHINVLEAMAVFLTLKRLKPKKGFPYQTGPGQTSSSPLPKQEGLSVETCQSRHDSHLHSGTPESMASISNTSSRSPERDCRLPIQNKTPGIRMVPGRSIIPHDLQTPPRPPSGLIRDRIQPKALLLRGSQHGPSCLCNRCITTGLEPVEEDISLPTSQLPHEGSPQAEILQGQSGSCSPRLAKEQLVPSSAGTATPPPSASQPDFDTGSPNQDCISFVLANESLGFMDFLKFAAKRRFGIEAANIDFTEADKSESTIRQYNSAFKKLLSFIHKEKPKEMDTNLAISFFRSLHESGLAASTVTTTKSALAKIFYYAFDMRLNDLCFLSIARSCARL